MGAKKHVIIGSGSAGLSAAEEIRRITREDDIKIVAAEDCPPYSPTLLPYVLSGKIDEEKLLLRKPDYFDRIRATFVRGKEITGVAPESKEVFFKDGGRETYDTLLIATGARSSLPAIEGINQVGSCEFHTVEDCNRLLSRLKGKTDVVVLGGGLVGLEVAIGLVDRGCRVTVIERETGLLPLYLDRKAGAIIADIFEKHGVRLIVGKAVTEVGQRNGNIFISFSDGESVRTEQVVTCTGVKARTEFLEGSGISVNQGVLVNRRMMTNIQDIYAAGDVAEAPGFLTGRRGMNQIIESAADEGRIAGSNMAGVEATYEGWISSNIFHFFGNIAFSAGLSTQDTESHHVLTAGNREKSQYSKFVFNNHHLVGAISINIELEPGLILYLIRNRIDLNGYEELLSEHAKETSRWLMAEAEHKGDVPFQG